MNRGVIAGAAVLVAGATGAVALRAAGTRSAHAHVDGGTTDGKMMDSDMAAVRAMYEAPTASTPCESAYLALKTSLDLSTAKHLHPVVLRLAPHDDFVARCNQLPPDVQKCAVPQYMAHHRSECEPLRPPLEVRQAMYEIKPPGAWIAGEDEAPSPSSSAAGP